MATLVISPRRKYSIYAVNPDKILTLDDHNKRYMINEIKYLLYQYFKKEHTFILSSFIINLFFSDFIGRKVETLTLADYLKINKRSRRLHEAFNSIRSKVSSIVKYEPPFIELFRINGKFNTDKYKVLLHFVVIALHTAINKGLLSCGSIDKDVIRTIVEEYCK